MPAPRPPKFPKKFWRVLARAPFIFLLGSSISRILSCPTLRSNEVIIYLMPSIALRLIAALPPKFCKQNFGGHGLAPGKDLAVSPPMFPLELFLAEPARLSLRGVSARTSRVTPDGC